MGYEKKAEYEPADSKRNKHYSSQFKIDHTAKNSGVEASTEPPNHTANLWIAWLTTLTSTGCA